MANEEGLTSPTSSPDLEALLASYPNVKRFMEENQVVPGADLTPEKAELFRQAYLADEEAKSLPKPTGDTGPVSTLSEEMERTVPFSSTAMSLLPQLGAAAVAPKVIAGAALHPAMRSVLPYLSGVVGEAVPQAVDQIAAAAMPDNFKEPKPLGDKDFFWQAGAPAISQTLGDTAFGIQKWWRGPAVEAQKNVSALLKAKELQEEVEQGFRQELIGPAIFKPKRGTLLPEKAQDPFFELANTISRKVGGHVDEYGKGSYKIASGDAELYPKLMGTAKKLSSVKEASTTIEELDKAYAQAALQAKTKVGRTLKEGDLAQSRVLNRLEDFKNELRNPRSSVYNKRYADLEQQRMEAYELEDLEAAARIEEEISKIEIPFDKILQHKQDVSSQLGHRDWLKSTAEDANNAIADKSASLALKDLLDLKAVKSGKLDLAKEFIQTNHEYHVYASLKNLIASLPQSARAESSKIGLLGKAREFLRVGSGGPRMTIGSPLGEPGTLSSLATQLNRAIPRAPESNIPAVSGIFLGDILADLSEEAIMEAGPLSGLQNIPEGKTLLSQKMISPFDVPATPPIPAKLPRRISVVKSFPQAVENALLDPTAKQQFKSLIEKGDDAGLGSFLADSIGKDPGLQAVFEEDPKAGESFDSFLPQEAKGVYYKKNVDQGWNREVDWTNVYQRSVKLVSKGKLVGGL